MSAYNPPKNQPPIFDTTQFNNQEQEKLNFPIAQGTEEFQDIVINGVIIIPATPIAYLNQIQTFTALNTFNGGVSIPNTLTLYNQAIQDSYLSPNVPLKNANNTFTALNTFNGGLTIPNSLTLYNNAIQDSYLSPNVPLKNANNTFTALNTFNGGLTIPNTLTLYNNAIQDSYLSPNVPLKNANNTFTALNTFNGGLTIPNTLTLYNNAIIDTYLSPNVPLKNINNIFSGSTNTFNNITLSSNSTLSQSGTGIISQTGTGTNTLKNTSIADLSVSGTLTLPSQSIADSALSTNVPLKNANNTFTALNTFNGGLTIPNTLTLYNQAILDSYLSSNVPLKTANNTYTGDNTFATIKFTNSTSVQQITLFEVSPTNYAENYSITINPFTLRYNTNSTGNHVFSHGTGTTYTNIATINSTGLSMAGKVSLSGSNFIELLDSTNTIASYITQIGGTLDIHNFGTGSVKITSPSLDLTNTYTYIQGAELDFGSILAFLDSTQTYATDLNQNSTNFLIENQYNSSTITLRNKNASGTPVNHTFAYNAISLNAPITMGTNNNLTMQGSGKIIQASTTSTNILNPTEFQGDITFAAGVSRIDQTGGGNGALLRQLTMLANFDIIFNSGTGKINQTSSSGVNTMGAITMNAGTNLTQTTTSIIDQSSSTGGINLLKAITMNANSNFLQSGTGIISQSGTGVNTLKAITMNAGTNITQSTTSIIDQSSSTGGINLLKAITMNANTNFLQSGTGILSQAGTGINLLKNITQNVDCNLLQSGIGVITQTGTGTNALKGSTFSGSNTHYNGSAIIQYDSTNAVSTTLSQANTSSYLIENNYNSSEIRLRNKNAIGGSVDYVFAYGGATFFNTLFFENNNVVAYRSGSNQTNVGQSGTSFVCENTTNSNSMIFRVKNSTGIPIDAITTDYNNTTIANNLVCSTTSTITGQLTLQSNTNLPTTYTAPTAGQLGFIKFGSATTPSPNPYTLVV